MTLRDYQKAFVRDIMQAYARGSRSICGVMPCGAGKTVVAAAMAEDVGRAGKNTLILVHRRELQDQTANKLQALGLDMSRLNVEMVQTLSRRPDRIAPPALIITDEGHHALAASYRKIYDVYSNARRLSLTATPVRLNGQGLGDEHDVLIEGASASWLIEHGYLADYDYYAPKLADMAGVHVRRGEYIQSEIEQMMNVPRIFGNATKHYKRIADGKQAILYAASVELSKKTAEAFSAQGIAAAHIDGKTPKTERKNIIDAFRKGEVKVLCNVDIVGEGFDVPDCEAVILMRPTMSLALHIQQSMRCMRPKKGKRAIIIDHVDNISRHGLPDEEREWSLNTVKKKKSSKIEPSAIRMCPECFRVCKKDAKSCPHCGHKFAASRAREIEADDSAELKKIEKQGFKVRYMKTPAECVNFYELQQYAKAKGYKPGWAYYQAKARGLI